MELFILEECSKSGSFILLAFVGDDSDGGCPLLELVNPVLNGHERHHDKEGSLVALVPDQVSEQRDSLDGLTKTHLICKDAIQVVVVEGDHPV